MTRVLAISDSFHPGFRGGSIRSLTNLVDRLDDRCEFWVRTLDHDPGQADPFPGIETDRWVRRGHARVFYGSAPFRPITIRAALDEAQPDVVFLNSLFARGAMQTMLLRRAGLVPMPVVLAPEGEAGPGALAQKRTRKQVYLGLARAASLFDGVWWLARDPLEQRDIVQCVGPSDRIRVVRNLPPLGEHAPVRPIGKRPGEVGLLYLSRITPKKNLLFLLDALQGVTARVHLDVVGPADSSSYRVQCEARAAALPPQVTVAFRGECLPTEVPQWLAGAHAVVLPSLDENYGYAIAEALTAARPVMLSVHTPWRGLAEARAGWDLPLVREVWIDAVMRLAAMDDEAYQPWSSGARARALREAAPEVDEQAALRLFSEAAATR